MEVTVLNSLLILATFWIGCNAMVCFHGICDHLPKRIPDKCQGSTIKNGGFCGCYDVCAKQEGEDCEAELIRGRPSLGTCDHGLTCQAQEHMIIGAGKCVKSNETNNSARSTQTLCQQRRIHALISQVVYAGQWFPKCDAVGNFLPQQCNNIGECFCVDEFTGTIDESTRVEGSAYCSKTLSVATSAPSA